MNNYKPQSPLVVNGNGVFPLTTYDQVIMNDGSRWNGEANNIHVGDNEPDVKYKVWIDTSEETATELMRSDSIIYIGFSINTEDWVDNTYTFNRAGITASHVVINLTLDANSQKNQVSALNWETVQDNVILSTETLPSGNITGYMILLPVIDRTNG